MLLRKRYLGNVHMKFMKQKIRNNCCLEIWSAFHFSFQKGQDKRIGIRNQSWKRKRKWNPVERLIRIHITFRLTIGFTVVDECWVVGGIIEKKTESQKSVVRDKWKRITKTDSWFILPFRTAFPWINIYCWEKGETKIWKWKEI